MRILQPEDLKGLRSQFKVSFTGHRPDKLGGYSPTARVKLGRFANRVLINSSPDVVICGMAQGFDMAIANGCVTLGMEFIAAVPFPGQERQWPEEAQEEYRSLLEHAWKVHYVSGPGYAAWKLHLRNEWMVDKGDYLVGLWDGSLTGGTYSCIEYAKRNKRLWQNVWEDWKEFSS